MKHEIHRLNQKISRLEDRLTDVASKVTSGVPRSTSHPSNLRGQHHHSHDEPHVGPRHIRRSPSTPTRHGGPEGVHHSSSTEGPEGSSSRSPAHHHSTLSIHSPRTPSHDDLRRQKRKEKSRSKNTPSKSSSDLNVSPSDSTVRGMLEDEITEQEKDVSARKEQQRPPPRSKSKENL